jgi:hypothetical protein
MNRAARAVLVLLGIFVLPGFRALSSRKIESGSCLFRTTRRHCSTRIRDTPAEVIDKLNKEINAVAADPLIKARFAGLGVDPMSMTSAAFGKFIADETEKWGNVIRALNIKAE